MPEKETKNDKRTYADSCEEIVRTLSKVVRQVAGDPDQVGLLVDCWGGSLFYAYRGPSRELSGRIVIDLLSDFHQHKEAMADFLPSARNEYIRRLRDGIDNGLYELAIKSLEPLYKETGKTYRRKSTILAEDPDDPEAPLIEKYVEKREFKNGVITRTRKKGPGQHSQWTKAKLETVVKAALALLPTPRDRTYAKILEILKQFYPDKSPKSPEALRKLLERFKIDLKELKNRTVSG